MNTWGLTDGIAREHRLSKALSRRILDTVLNTIRSELKQGHIVRIRNFGTFQASKSHGKPRAKFDDSRNFFKTDRW